MSIFSLSTIPMDESSPTVHRALDLLAQARTVLRVSEALVLGVDRYTPYSLLENGLVERLARGLYQLTSLPPVAYPDEMVIARHIPRGVLCLISALAFHNITTQVPRLVWVALPPGVKHPQFRWPPIRVMRFGGEVYTAGVETHVMHGTPVRIYCAEKTIADCFRYRNKVGLDIALEALRYYRQRRLPDISALTHYTHIGCVDYIMRPYVAALAFE